MSKKPYTDEEFEALVRQTLAERAQDAPKELPTTAPASAPARQARRWWLPVAAAAAVTVAIPAGVLWRGATGPADRAAHSPTSASVSSSPASAPTSGGPERPAGVPSDWRAESYAGVQVWVPPTWGWGGTPTRDPTGGPSLDCSEGRAFTVPGSSAYADAPADTPFVGRPVLMTDACASGIGAAPAVDAVWLGASGVREGITTHTNGRTSQTKVVARIPVTVISDDAALRARILDSASPSPVDAYGCPASPSTLTSVPTTPTPPRALSVTGLSICVYRNLPSGPDGGEFFGRLWSGSVGADRAQDFARAVGPEAPDARPVRLDDPCGSNEPINEHIYLGVNALVDGQRRTQWHWYCYGEGVVVTLSEQFWRVPISEANTRPWAEGRGGVKAYVVGPSGSPRYAEFFRGMLG